MCLAVGLGGQVDRGDEERRKENEIEADDEIADPYP